MACWVKYTEKDDGTPIYVNLDAAQFIRQKDDCTEIYMQGRPVVRVAETSIFSPYSEENDEAVEIEAEVLVGRPGASNFELTENGRHNQPTS